MLMGYAAGLCFMLSVVFVLMSFAASWAYLLPAYLLMQAACFIVGKIRYALDVLISMIVGAIFFVVPVLVLGFVLWLAVNHGIVHQDHLRALRVVSWFFPKIIGDALEGAFLPSFLICMFSEEILDSCFDDVMRHHYGPATTS
jgi:hypothetical protein